MLRDSPESLDVYRQPKAAGLTNAGEGDVDGGDHTMITCCDNTLLSPPLPHLSHPFRTPSLAPKNDV